MTDYKVVQKLVCGLMAILIYVDLFIASKLLVMKWRRLITLNREGITVFWA